MLNKWLKIDYYLNKECQYSILDTKGIDWKFFYEIFQSIFGHYKR